MNLFLKCYWEVFVIQQYLSKCIWNVYYVNLDGISSLSLLLASKVGDLMVTSTYKHEDIYKKQVTYCIRKVRNHLQLFDFP